MRDLSNDVVDSIWLYKTKRKANRCTDHFKARLFAKGFTQRPGLLFSWDTQSRCQTNDGKVGSIYSCATQLANPSTLRQRCIPSRKIGWSSVYVTTQGFINHPFLTHICKMKKAIYGHKRAPDPPTHRYNSLHEHLLKMGFVRTKSNTLLFVWKHMDVTICVLVYADDIIITGNHPKVISFFINSLAATFSLKDLCYLNYFLVVYVHTRLSHSFLIKIYSWYSHRTGYGKLKRCFYSHVFHCTSSSGWHFAT